MAASVQSMESDLLACFKKGVELIQDKIVDPITIPSKKATEKGRKKISKHSLRGDNRFVQMAVCDVNNPEKIVYMEQYAYQIPLANKKILTT